ncbi:plasmid stabilization protein [Rhizobium sp. Root274]|uniref:type II toxin-antitoxin system RelE/ParE family toxin n=1 Tax=unclassified Rhizobium TaxID=2613769 RepID=UPI0007133584|nr:MULTISPECIES: type II toxin-antitoxin system RelE/ParE family toxin [unclassified Rhizobium]KQW32049.1 plasmid stabilization protein [Rhizobium sp. Root1240]KRD33586.1 plasmid stabilization protein [Rhizobium sp. Root274]
MARPVVWSVDAYRDTLAILRHIAEDDPDTAERIVDIIEDAGHRLGERSTGRPGRVAGTFEKSLAPLPWILCYSIQTDADHESVLILRVIHTARNWPGGTWPESD